jgi:hypothetical protein
MGADYMRYENVIEDIITKKLEKKAEELNVKFKVKFSEKNEVPDFLVRIQKTTPELTKESSMEEINKAKEEGKRLKEFADFVGDIIVSDYSNQVRFSYPTKL